MTQSSPQEDLPLMSNVDDILVRHYNFNFECNFLTKTFSCSVLLFLEPVCDDPSFSKESRCGSGQHIDKSRLIDAGFILILDCHKIVIKQVTAMSSCAQPFQSERYSLEEGEVLPFQVADWSLKIWKNSETCKYCFPRLIRVSYETTSSCPSVLWTSDQDGNPAVFSHGAFINNRALFPCQEPPVAMATWEATVTVADPLTVLMSGDEAPRISREEGLAHYYYFTKKVLPLSTLCLAIGRWQEHSIQLDDKKYPKCRLFAPSHWMDRAIQEFSDYIPRCLEASLEVLGSYPFPRIDFLVVPPTFSSLGMASPNLVFVSQSLVVGDRSLCCRLSHEVSHGWFGLSIGALDWTEEWLSEGFATLAEDHLHARALQMSPEDCRNYLELKALIRKKTLLDEIENTQEELQILRASQGEESKQVVDGVSVPCLRNGQNPVKGFIQIHYIKGYFLLKYLSSLVGIDAFLDFLRTYVVKYEGKLVTSKEFLTFFLNSFSSLSSLSVESMYQNWLHTPGSTAEIKNMRPSPENHLFREVLEETVKWKKFNTASKRKVSKRRKLNKNHFSPLLPDQTVLLLENLLSVERVRNRTLEQLDDVFHFASCNAEVVHRWMELVVKHRHSRQYAALRDYLVNHMAMGVYLYGELIYSGDEAQEMIAKECFSITQEGMEPNFRHTIQQMFVLASES